ncbi:MAG TPA: glycoside hydrolase family 11 protein [Polyangiaceae bacterium]|nr:glycoside hydrolase family 11 protein [Polyangiaceae bacterium]
MARRSRESYPWSSAVAFGLAAVALSSCSNSGGNADGGSAGAAPATTGGTSSAGAGGSSVTGSGGTTPAAGASGRGGSSGTTGSSGAGGSLGAGGASAGSAGRGGSANLGGSSGAGGATGSAGTATSGAAGATGGTAGNGAGGAVGAAGSGGARAGGGGSAGASAGAGGTASTCPAATPPTGGTKYCSNSKGTADGNYAYELWTNGTGTGCMTVYGADATFSATWTNAGDLLARNGLGFDQTKTPSQIGTIGADFAEMKTGDSGLVYVGIYGWTVNPLREYYIIDDWGDTKPGDTASDGSARTHVGTIVVDGDNYDVWKHTQTNKPAITGGNATFDQYFSVRQNARQCGHISISDHFTQWTMLNLDLGDLEEAKLLVEAQNSSGTIDFTTATVTVK